MAQKWRPHPLRAAEHAAKAVIDWGSQPTCPPNGGGPLGCPIPARQVPELAHIIRALANPQRDLGGQAHGGENTVLPDAWRGMVKPGNLDLGDRPTVHNKNGSVSTVRSVSFNVGGREVLMPEVIGNRVVSPQQALAHYLGTGQNLGTFTTPKAADRYAMMLHLAQAAGR